MKRSLCLFILAVAAGLCSVLFVLWAVDREKDSITVTETVIEGDIAAAEGISVEIGTHWQGRLLWSTVYQPGHVQEAESSFDFSSQKTRWDYGNQAGGVSSFTSSGEVGGWRDRSTSYVDLDIVSTNFGTSSASGGNDRGVNIENMPWPRVLQAAAEQTGAGETRTVNLRVRDYYEYYPLELSVSGTVYLRSEATDFVTQYFKFPIPEDESFRVTIRKDWDGEVVELDCHSAGEGYFPWTVSARGDAGDWFSFYLEGGNKNLEQVQGEYGGQYAVYWLPYKNKEKMPWLDLENMTVAAQLPKDALPVTMRYDNERRILYLLTVQKGRYILLTYLDNNGELAPLQQIEILGMPDDAAISAAEGGNGNGFVPAFRKMSIQEDGILLTWQDNRFAFIARDGEEYRFWCDGIFPAKERDTGILEEKLAEGAYFGSENAFPYENAFAFDGTRLAIAAFEDWLSLDSRLVVYREGELAYSGCYRYSGELDRELSGVYGEILPWGGNIKGRRRDGAAVGPVRVSIEPAAP